MSETINKMYLEFIKSEYNRLFRTAYCPKCGQNLDANPVKLTTKEGPGIERVLCPNCGD